MAQIEELRQWRNNAIESHLYSTAELVGDKILAMSNQADDGYWLAQTYYGMGEYLRGAQLILRHSFESESLKCRYIAGLCLVQAQELEKALALLTNTGSSAATSSIGNDTSSSQIVISTGTTPVSGSRNPSWNFNSAAAAAAPAPGFKDGSQPLPKNSAQMGNNRARVISTSSLKNPDARGGRTISGSSRVSVILPDLDDESFSSMHSHEDLEELNGVFVESLIQFLLGRVYTLQAKFGLAKEAYIAALRIDVRCFDALSQLVKYHALTPKEEWSLLASLDFSRVRTDFGRSLYAMRLSVLTHENELADAASNLIDTYQLPEDNADILAVSGDLAFSRGQFARAKALYEQILATDAHNLRVLTNYVSTLFELKETSLLYRISHELAATSPDAVETWYATGIYYLATQRIPEARRDFSKASLIDPGYAEAWLAFARTFAEESEHEKAITAFSTVARLFPGYHLPYVHIGIQHLQLSNLSLAEKYLATAAEFFEEDPLLLNELGVVFYHKNDFARALQMLEMALAVAQKLGSDVNMRVSIKSNLGYTLRRIDRFSEALEAFEDVCRNAPLDSNVLAAMGLCYLQMNESERATEKLALALAITRDDPVANDLMKRAVRQSSESFDSLDFAQQHQKYIRRGRVEISFD